MSDSPVFLGLPGVAPIVSIFIRFFVGTLLARVVTAFGISIVSYSAISSIAGMVRTHFLAMLSAGGSTQIVQVAQAMGLASAANIIFSAYIGSLGIRAAMGFTKRLTFGNSEG